MYLTRLLSRCRGRDDLRFFIEYRPLVGYRRHMYCKFEGDELVCWRWRLDSAKLFEKEIIWRGTAELFSKLPKEIGVLIERRRSGEWTPVKGFLVMNDLSDEYRLLKKIGHLLCVELRRLGHLVMLYAEDIIVPDKYVKDTICINSELSYNDFKSIVMRITSKLNNVTVLTAEYSGHYIFHIRLSSELSIMIDAFNTDRGMQINIY